MGVQGSSATQVSLTSQALHQEAGSQVGQPTLKPVFVWDAGASGSDLIYYIPQCHP